jgi:hypothetical protein
MSREELETLDPKFVRIVKAKENTIQNLRHNLHQAHQQIQILSNMKVNGDDTSRLCVLNSEQSERHLSHYRNIIKETVVRKYVHTYRWRQRIRVLSERLLSILSYVAPAVNEAAAKHSSLALQLLQTEMEGVFKGIGITNMAFNPVQGNKRRWEAMDEILDSLETCCYNTSIAINFLNEIGANAFSRNILMRRQVLVQRLALESVLKENKEITERLAVMEASYRKLYLEHSSMESKLLQAKETETTLMRKMAESLRDNIEQFEYIRAATNALTNANANAKTNPTVSSPSHASAPTPPTPTNTNMHQDINVQNQSKHNPGVFSFSKPSPDQIEKGKEAGHANDSDDANNQQSKSSNEFGKDIGKESSSSASTSTPYTSGRDAMYANQNLPPHHQPSKRPSSATLSHSNVPGHPFVRASHFPPQPQRNQTMYQGNDLQGMINVAYNNDNTNEVSDGYSSYSNYSNHPQYHPMHHPIHGMNLPSNHANADRIHNKNVMLLQQVSQASQSQQHDDRSKVRQFNQQFYASPASNLKIPPQSNEMMHPPPSQNAGRPAQKQPNRSNSNRVINASLSRNVSNDSLSNGNTKTGYPPSPHVAIHKSPSPSVSSLALSRNSSHASLSVNTTNHHLSVPSSNSKLQQHRGIPRHDSNEMLIRTDNTDDEYSYDKYDVVANGQHTNGQHTNTNTNTNPEVHVVRPSSSHSSMSTN